jgi:hypothetical protein
MLMQVTRKNSLDVPAEGDAVIVFLVAGAESGGLDLNIPSMRSAER